MLSSELKIEFTTVKACSPLPIFVLTLKLPAFSCFSSTLIIMENILSTKKIRKMWQRNKWGNGEGKTFRTSAKKA